MSNNVKFKIVILGTQGVGKTCLINRFVNDKFSDKYQSTVAGIFRAKYCSSHGQIIQVGIWDTVGDERYKSLNQMFYRGARAAIVCYDICDAKSWNDVKYWISELRKHEEDCKIYLCGTKKDLITEGYRDRDISYTVTSKHAAGIQAKILEVSSKTGENVAQLLQTIVDDFVETNDLREELELDQNIQLSSMCSRTKWHCCNT